MGGIKDFEQAVNHTGKHIQTDDFLGCMRNVFINGKELELSSSTDSAGIRDRCPRLGQCLAGQCKKWRHVFGLLVRLYLSMCGGI